MITTMLLMMAAPFAQVASPYPPDDVCMEADTSGMVRCQKHDIAIWERRLEEEYRSALSRVGPVSQERLRQAQETWLRYRDANCRFYEGHGGTISHLLGGGCVIRMTTDRTIELHGLGAGFE